MRFNSIPALTAVLSLGASGVLSSVIPQTHKVLSSTESLEKEATFCIKDFCATTVDNKQTTTQCGPVTLTITHLGASSSVEECVSQFSYLIAQDTESGISQTVEALYEISAEDGSGPATNEKRAKTKATKKTTTAKTTSSKAAKATSSTAAKTTSSAAAKPTSSKASSSKVSSSKATSSKAASSKASSIKTSAIPSTTGKPSETSKISTSAGITSKPSSKISSIKTSGSQISSKPSGSNVSSVKPTGSTVSSKISSSATPSSSACPLPRKDKNGKPIQRRCAGDEFYKKRDLIVGKVTHWKFNTMGDISTYNADANAKLVLQKMNKNGQLDVVKVSSGDLTVVGNVNDQDIIVATQRGTDPNTFTKKGGNYLLTNGGFFQHMEMKPRSFEPAGEDTVVKTADGTVMGYEEPFPLPADYAPFYDQIDGLENTRVHSGPDLKKTIPDISTNSGIWKYNENDPILVGRLSHASQPNERLALVRFGATHYSIAYTCKERVPGLRECGINTNKFKEIIDLFFSKMGETGKSIGSSTQAVCLDGGPSISMTWNAGTTMEKLSLGGAGDNTPAPGASGRKVGNLIKIAAK